ncbi:hypothetical protein GCM10011575_15570 [Microlunatus endophyticus]|uniref:Uncharacterized protein n=1 Tax=Microlunatus endophyticus TaxID=1716077 RepID=A0A917S4V4_9ACTN|nr:hypothetical protein GCM10011575_15570 [Microlunatus endophyticus]
MRTGPGVVPRNWQLVTQNRRQQQEADQKGSQQQEADEKGSQPKERDYRLNSVPFTVTMKFRSECGRSASCQSEGP